MLIRFESSSAMVEIPACPIFLNALRSAARDWPFEEVSGDAGAPSLRVEEVGGRYHVHDDGHEVTETTAVGGACLVMVEIIESCIEDAPKTLWLHCGSVLINGRLVVFPSHSHAGKSTLIARLAAAGYTVFGDDILPLTADDGFGTALGLAPRLRLPLPSRASAPFVAFVDGHRGATDGRYLFLDLGPEGLAARGRIAPLGAIVLLDRRAAGPASVGPAPRAVVLQTLVNQNFTLGEAGMETLDRLHKVMDEVPCLTLQYSDLEDAIALVARTFEAWPVDVGSILGGTGTFARPPLTAAGDEDALLASAPPLRWSSNVIYARAARVDLREVEGELFLAGSDDAIYHLNPVGAGVWRLLEEPASRCEVTDVVAAAFPHVERETIENDVTSLLAGLVAAGFVTPSRDQSSR